MNFGLIVRKALQRAELPVNDAEHLNLARDYANDVITNLWSMVKADFRESRDTLTTVAGSDEYVVNKMMDVPTNQGFVLNSLRGPATNPRIFTYYDPSNFFRVTRNFQNAQGIPYIFTFGDVLGVDAQLVTGSQIQVFSSLASKTTGSINVASGSRRVTATQAGQFNLNDVGLRFQVNGDSASYGVAVFIDSQNIDLDDVYRGNDQNGALYKIGDVGIHANIQGFIGGQIDSEDVILDGSNPVLTTKNFSSLTSCSKSDLTGGRITFQNSTGVQTVAVLAPNETEVERQTIVLWRIPSASEVLSYRFYMKHPILRLDTDRLLIPTKYHNLVGYMTEAWLKDWAGMSVGDWLKKNIEEGQNQFINDANDASLWTTIPQEVGSGFGFGQPDNYGSIVDADFMVGP